MRENESQPITSQHCTASTNHITTLHSINQSQHNTAQHQPITSQHCTASTNHITTLHSINQSHHNTAQHQPITSQHCTASTNHITTLHSINQSHHSNKTLHDPEEYSYFSLVKHDNRRSSIKQKFKQTASGLTISSTSESSYRDKNRSRNEILYGIQCHRHSVMNS